MEDRIGSLAPRKQADIIMIRTDDLNLFPASNPKETVLYHSNSGNVDTVIIAVSLRKRAGRLLDDDLPRRKEQLAESRRRILHDGGFLH